MIKTGASAGTPPGRLQEKPPFNDKLAKEPAMKDFWAFRTMVTPVIIQIIFWVGVLVTVVAGAVMLIYGIRHYEAGLGRYIYKGALLLCLGPLGVRVYCEILIVFFRINETLTEIKHGLEGRQPPA
jgi:hypothetical protein